MINPFMTQGETATTPQGVTDLFGTPFVPQPAFDLTPDRGRGMRTVTDLTVLPVQALGLFRSITATTPITTNLPADRGFMHRQDIDDLGLVMIGFHQCVNRQ